LSEDVEEVGLADESDVGGLSTGSVVVKVSGSVVSVVGITAEATDPVVVTC
jgi:hypothetical protein